jgi:DNA-binding Xre family transcriptional regulator
MELEIKTTEANMGTFINKIPKLLEERGLTPMDLIHQGMAYNTAYRVARGELDFTLTTALQLCNILGVNSLDDIIEYRKDEHSGT